MIRKLFSAVRGKKRYNRFFEFRHDVSLKGMNYGVGDINNDGELFVLDLISNLLKGDLIIFDVGAK